MIEFYNVRKRAKVSIPKDKVEKKILEKETKSGEIRFRYAFASVDEDGTKMMKFCSKDAYDSF